MYECTPHVCRCLGRPGESDALELELEVAVSGLTWVLRKKLEFFKHSYKRCEVFAAKPSLKPVA